MQRLHGYSLVLFSALAFGVMPIFARLAYATGMDPASLLCWRFLIGAICMAVVAGIRRTPFPRGRTLLILLFLGLIGYAGQSFSYFTALTLIPAGLVAILLYLHPVFVMLLSALFFKERITAGKALAMLMALTGTVLVIGIQTGGAPLGIIWGFAAAVIYSFYIIVSAVALRGSDPSAASPVVMAGAAISVFLIAAPHGVKLPHTAGGWLWIVCIAVFCTAIAISFFFSGIKMVGPVDASLISTFEPPTTVILAFIFLGEHVGLLQIAGMALILGAATVLALQPTASKA